MTPEVQAVLNGLIDDIQAFRGLFETAMEFGDHDQMEDAFNGVAQIAYTAHAIDIPGAPLADPTRTNGYALEHLDYMEIKP